MRPVRGAQCDDVLTAWTRSDMVKIVIDWRDVATEDIQLLALIADKYGWSISRMLRHLNVLTQDERDVVVSILRPAQQQQQAQASANTQETSYNERVI